MKKVIGFIYVCVFLQISSIAQIGELDSLLFEKLNNELLLINEEVIIDIDFYYGINGKDKGSQLDLKKDGKKIKAISEYLLNYPAAS